MDIGERKAEINSKQKLNKIISEEDKCYDRNKQDDMKILREQAVVCLTSEESTSYKCVLTLLWTECLSPQPPPPIHMLKSNPPFDGVWIWGFGEVIRS